MTLQLRFVSHSEVGPVRKNNQDSGYASPRLLVVADGMGGAAAGDLASAVAINTIRDLDGAADRPPSPDPSPGTGPMLQRLAEAISRANERIADLIAADHHLEGMGTTVTGALFDGTEFGLAHIGDSRAYLMRGDRLERLTHDHSWVQSLVDDGKISDAEAAVHPHRSLLLKVLNGQPANDPDLTTVRAEPGDRLLFCSDGICGLVDDEEIASALRTPDLEAALDRLVEEALAEGGIDNITAIVADVVEGTGSGATATLGSAAERAIPDLEADTLTRAGPVVDDHDPDLTTAGATSGTVAAAADEARYDPRAPHRRRLLRPLVGLIALVLVLGAGAGAGWLWSRSQFYVGAAAADGGERVAIFRGLPEGLPGLSLSSVFEIQPLALSALPSYYADQVRTGIEVASLDAARQTVAELTATARRCAQSGSGSSGPSPRPTPSSGSPTTASAGATSRSPAASPQPTTASPAPGGAC